MFKIPKILFFIKLILPPTPLSRYQPKQESLSASKPLSLSAFKMSLDMLFENAAEKFAADALKRYETFLVANAKPLTMAERVKGTVRPKPCSFEQYLEACLASTKQTPARCDFQPRETAPRGRTMERAPGMIRYPSPDGLCHEETPAGRHCCHHPAFGRDYYMGTRYGVHYTGTYSAAAVEKLHMEEVDRARLEYIYATCPDFS